NHSGAILSVRRCRACSSSLISRPMCRNRRREVTILRCRPCSSIFGLEPSAQRWLISIATVPVAIVFAILFCPVNDLAVALSRRFGVALFGGREASLTRAHSRFFCH